MPPTSSRGMPLNLDLRGSRAKLARAAHHLGSLDRELPIARNHQPVALRVTEVDQDTGWCEVYGSLLEIEEPLLAVITDDYVHNLRSALDYIVTGLVEASGADLHTRHQFPIYESKKLFRKEVGTGA